MLLRGANKVVRGFCQDRKPDRRVYGITVSNIKRRTLLISGGVAMMIAAAYYGNKAYNEKFGKPKLKGKDPAEAQNSATKDQVKIFEPSKAFTSEISANIEVPSESSIKKADTLIDQPIFKEVFTDTKLPFEIHEFQPVMANTHEDSLLLLVPPTEDKDLFTTLKDMIADLSLLYNKRISDSEEDSEGLKVRYIKIKSRKDLQDIGKLHGVDLDASNDVPMMILKNKLKPKPTVLTLLDLIDNQDKYYSQYIPLKQVTSQNLDKFKHLLDTLPEHETIFLHYCHPHNGQFDQMRNQLYEDLTNGSFNDLKSIKVILSEEIDWLSDKDYAATIDDGDVLAIQRHGSDSLAGPEVVKTIEGLRGKYLIYKVAHNSVNNHISAGDFLRKAGEEYYKHNVASNLELSPGKARYSIEFKYDKNKMNEAQYRAALAALKSAREAMQLMSSDVQKIKLFMVPHSFEPSEGKAVSLIIRDQEKAVDRFQYLFKVKLKQEAKRLELEKPWVMSNDSFEYQFPEDLQFNGQGIATFVERVLAGQVADKIQSEVIPAYDRWSREVSGDTYEELIKSSDAAQGVFFYSTTCGSCKKFAPLWEKLAKENLSKQLAGMGTLGYFNRVNKDLNSPRGEKNFDSTPIFLLYRADYKRAPYIYKNSYLTETAMREFLSLTNEFSLLREDLVSKLALKAQPPFKDLLSTN